ncbi:uncharacterized protein LOC111290224 [Durio zibethinus]|uniref:Uncharacterized protein LOC111290224 n=1 Tax=Durio zibethinus TaxID=66656 RepID=A0A6P5YAC0_DURZI|nr:uncharacterized protein LOC111290224 [Durio zibethinus]
MALSPQLYNTAVRSIHGALHVMASLERELEEENKKLKSQLELEQCFQPAQGLGDPNIEVGNEYNRTSSQANHAQQEPCIQMGYHRFIPQERGTEARVDGGSNKHTAGWL